MSAVAGIAGVDLGGLGDHDLLAVLRDDAQRSNYYQARSLAATEEFRRRQARIQHAQAAREPFFALTPVEETIVEVGPLVGADPGRIKAQLHRTKILCEDFPGLWALCRTGQLEVYKATLVTEAALSWLEDPADVTELDTLMTRWFQHTLPRDQGPQPLVAKTSKQIRNRVSYLLKKLRPQDANTRFNKAFADRSVDLRQIDDGIGHLTLSHAYPYLQAADHRLTQLAKQQQANRRHSTATSHRDGGGGDGDGRTLAQLRADTMVDLILGKLTTEPAAHPAGDGADPAAPVLRRHRAPSSARPVINVTVPIQTLLGVSEDPATLSGGASIPAALARILAQDPDSTWYRMLTDPARTSLELSTTAYQPTRAIWRQVVADHTTCYQPGCTRPATDCELDHRIPHPHGATSTDNLAPACKRDHKAKHAGGFSLQKLNTGELAFTTRAGFTHHLPRQTQPATTTWPEALMNTEERFAAIVHTHNTHADTDTGTGTGADAGAGAENRRIQHPHAENPDHPHQPWHNKHELHVDYAREMAGKLGVPC